MAMVGVDKEMNQKPTNMASTSRPRGPSKSQQMNKFYALPAPLRTFPLPTLIPHNPISLFHVVYTWVSQTIFPPSSHPETLYHGWLSPETRSVHVTDPRSIKSLWEQGFYGKGSLSRSELSWLEREKKRRGASTSQTSEDVTRQRRAERQQTKWERARKEREAINQKLLEERGIGLSETLVVDGGHPHANGFWRKAPVGPLEILALPNSSVDLGPDSSETSTAHFDTAKESSFADSGSGRASNKLDMVLDLSSADGGSNIVEQVFEQVDGKSITKADGIKSINGVESTNGSANNAFVFNRSAESPKQVKGQKSVRFSPTVEQTTYLQSEPPSPELAAPSLVKVEGAPSQIENQEHLQLTMEEAFFLCYGLGVLKILDPCTKEAISTRDLLSVFRNLSYFTPQQAPVDSPDDPFLVSYVVYHHFRSLGWVVRGGTKFSVDYLLYNRGPVFSHAEFAVLILPSYSDPAWSKDAKTRDYVAKKERRRWPWLHCINRVNSHVKKTLVMVYVDIPPVSIHRENDLSIDKILKRYSIREFVVKRWLSNRSRD